MNKQKTVKGLWLSEQINEEQARLLSRFLELFVAIMVLRIGLG